MKSKCENEAKKQDVDSWNDTWQLNYILRKKYVQKDLEKWEKQVKKMMVKQATMGMQAHLA